jgi:serine protease inhibitor
MSDFETSFNFEQNNNQIINRNRNNNYNDMNSRLQNRDMIDINIINTTKNKYKNTNRFEIERDEFMKNSNNDGEDDNSEFNKFDKFDRFDRFDRFDKIPNINDLKKKNVKNISSFDPYTNLADINNDTKLSDNLNEINVCMNSINDYGMFLFNNLLNIMNKNFIFSPFLIYSIFGSLFIASDDNTEVELKNYFNFPRVDVLSAGLTELYQKYLNPQILKSEIVMGNCIIFSDDINYNPQFCNNINNFTKIRKINKSDAKRESDNINKIIMTLMNSNKTSINAQSIENNSITLLNYANITPKWTSYFSKTSMINNIEYMHSYNQSFGYFEQQRLQVLELESTGNICFGIIYGDIDFNDKTYKLIISNLKRTYFKEVSVPKINIQTKLRYTNILKETDLNTVFLDLNTPNLFTSECEISDCIQNIQFNLTENSEKYVTKSIGLVSSKTFIVTQAFRFYIRLKSNNCILFLGSY